MDLMMSSCDPPFESGELVMMKNDVYDQARSQQGFQVWQHVL